MLREMSYFQKQKKNEKNVKKNVLIGIKYQSLVQHIKDKTVSQPHV